MTKEYIQIEIEIDPPGLRQRGFVHVICNLKNGRVLYSTGTTEREAKEAMFDLIYKTLKLGEEHLAKPSI